jgi:hypothetical protein
VEAAESLGLVHGCVSGVQTWYVRVSSGWRGGGVVARSGNDGDNGGADSSSGVARR